MEENKKALNRESTCHNSIIAQKEKTSFILYTDNLNVLDELNDEEAGKIFKAIRSYNLNGTYQLDGLLNAVFTPFKTVFDKNTEKYYKICEKNRENGKKGGRPRKTQKNPKKPSGFLENPKNLDNDYDYDYEYIEEKEKEKEVLTKHFNEFYLMYPLKKSRDKAKEAYKKAIKTAEPSEIIEGLKKYIKDIQDKRTESRFIKYPATWLNQGCWKDEYTPHVDYSSPEYHNPRL